MPVHIKEIQFLKLDHTFDFRQLGEDDLNNNYDVIIGNQIILNSIKVKNCKLIALIDTDKISNKTNYKSNEKYYQMLSGVVQKINNNSL